MTGFLEKILFSTLTGTAIILGSGEFESKSISKINVYIPSFKEKSKQCTWIDELKGQELYDCYKTYMEKQAGLCVDSNEGKKCKSNVQRASREEINLAIEKYWASKRE